MSARLPLALVLISVTLSNAPAQTRIPNSEMPGRERERFTTSPAERFQKPKPLMRLQSADPLPGAGAKHAPAHKKQRRKRL